MLSNVIDRWFDKYADKLLWVFIASYVFIFSLLCFLKYNSFGYYDWDFASNITTCWNSVNGRFLYYPFLEQNVFCGHFTPVLFLVFPIYAVFQHPLTLLFLQSFVLGIAAFPLYLTAKLRVNKTFALAISLCYLLYPSLGFINLFETHVDSFAIVFFFFSIYFFEKEKFANFFIFLILALSCKENMSFVVIMFGFYALLRKRAVLWVLAPLALGFFWFIATVKFIAPFFAEDTHLYPGGFMFGIYYSHLGGNIPEMLWNILAHPVNIFRFVFTPQKIEYLFKIFISTGFIGFLSPGPLLMTFLIFAQNMLSSVYTHTQIYYQYVAALIPFIFYSVITGFAKILKFKKVFAWRYLVLFAFVMIAIVWGIFIGAPQFHIAKNIQAFRSSDSSREKKRLVSLIPKDASVIATFQFLPRLASRHDIYSMHFVSTGYRMYTQEKYVPPKNLDFALIDFNEPLLLNSFFPPDGPRNIRAFIDTQDWRVLWAFDDVVLFKKKYYQGHKLCEVVQDPVISHPMSVDIDRQIMFLGYNVIPPNEDDDGRILHLVYYWKRLGAIKNNFGFFIQFLDSSGRNIFVKDHILGYRVYAPKDWQTGQIIQEHHYVLIPSTVPQGSYEMRAGLFDIDEGKVLPVFAEESVDDLGRIILGRFLLDF